MSNKSTRRAQTRGGIDRRARRTRAALAAALMAIAPKEGFDRLDVRKLAAKAGVGRSTFYKHYADKDDFLITSFAGMVAAFDAHARAGRTDYDTALPAREVFAHVAAARAFALSLAASGQFARTQTQREEKLRVIAEGNLRRLRPGLTLAQRQELSLVLAGAFTTLMRWWIDDGLRKEAAYVAALYESVARRLLAP